VDEGGGVGDGGAVGVDEGCGEVADVIEGGGEGFGGVILWGGWGFWGGLGWGGGGGGGGPAVFRICVATMRPLVRATALRVPGEKGTA
jgi:hypothetical protein